jgi:hypothetical protein
MSGVALNWRKFSGELLVTEKTVIEKNKNASSVNKSKKSLKIRKPIAPL